MKLSFIILSLVSGLAFSAPPRELSFYVVSPVEGKAPVIDGSLNEPAWEKAAVFRHYYVYNCAEPIPEKLKTEFRMLYDEKGIYLGIINFEEHPEKLRKIITDFDNSAIWTDDCAEIFFDARANGISYHCFKVNCIGTRADFRRRDAAGRAPSGAVPPRGRCPPGNRPPRRRAPGRGIPRRWSDEKDVRKYFRS